MFAEGVFWVGRWRRVAVSEFEAVKDLISVSGSQNGDGIRGAINLPTNYVCDSAKGFDRALGLENGEVFRE